MMDTKRSLIMRWLVIAVVIAGVSLSALSLCVACNKETPAPTANSGMTASTPKPRTPKKPADNAGKPGQAMAATGATTGGPAEKEAPVGPKVEVTDLLVDSPGIDYTGPGRYDLTVSALVEEVVEPAVWLVTAFGEDGKEVGKQLQFLMLSHAKPRTLILNDFYCLSIPVKVEITLTDKEPDSGGETTPAEDNKKPGGGSGGVSKPGLDAGKGNKPPAGGDKDKGGETGGEEDTGGGDDDQNM